MNSARSTLLAGECQYTANWELASEYVETNNWPAILALTPADREPPVENVWQAQVLAYAQWMMGDIERSMGTLVRGMLQHPTDTGCTELFARVSAWDAYLASNQLPAILLRRGQDLYLSPLGHHHVHDFAEQYRSPDIAELCCLPCFNKEEDWHDWLSWEMTEDHQLLMAIMHPAHGFVGVISLRVFNGEGFLYYWMGQAYRGRGFAQQAAFLLLEFAQSEVGVQRCFAKVYEHNHASINTLRQLGFNRLLIRAFPPNASELFFCLGEQGNSHLGLATVLQGLQSSIRIQTHAWLGDATTGTA